jgi:peptide/nickel transport system ATP-binding protein
VTEPVLSVEELTVSATADGGEPVVKGVSLEVMRGETYGILGSSGSGKSSTARAVIDVLPRGLSRTSGRIVFCGRDLTAGTAAEWAAVRGREIALIPQDPKASLVPVVSVGTQMVALHRATRSSNKHEARAAAYEALSQVYLPDPEAVLASYAHELSGGMAQRVTIAMAMMIEPRLLIADEPTTGLDVVLQFSVLELLHELMSQRGTSLILISHDLGVIANYTNRIAVMHRGRVVEQGETEAVFTRPADDYTAGLLAAAAPVRPAGLVRSSVGRSG